MSSMSSEGVFATIGVMQGLFIVPTVTAVNASANGWKDIANNKIEAGVMKIATVGTVISLLEHAAETALLMAAHPDIRPMVSAGFLSLSEKLYLNVSMFATAGAIVALGSHIFGGSSQEKPA